MLIKDLFLLVFLLLQLELSTRLRTTLLLLPCCWGGKSSKVVGCDEHDYLILFTVMPKWKHTFLTIILNRKEFSASICYLAMLIYSIFMFFSSFHMEKVCALADFCKTHVRSKGNRIKLRFELWNPLLTKFYKTNILSYQLLHAEYDGVARIVTYLFAVVIFDIHRSVTFQGGIVEKVRRFLFYPSFVT